MNGYPVGDAREPRFRATARVDRGGDPVESNAAVARTKEMARHLACLNLLAVLAGESDVAACVPDRAPSPAPEVVPPPKKLPDPANDPNPVGSLQEWCQARRLRSPEYAFGQSGPAHSPEITCTVRVAGREAAAIGGSKQDAKREAARALLGVLAGTG